MKNENRKALRELIKRIALYRRTLHESDNLSYEEFDDVFAKYGEEEFYNYQTMSDKEVFMNSFLMFGDSLLESIIKENENEK